MKRVEVRDILNGYEQGVIAPGTPLTAEETDLVQATYAYLVRAIDNAPDRKGAEAALFDLATFQEQLATLSFRFHVVLPEALREFVRVYDRSDVRAVRDQMYASIKALGDNA